MITVPWSSVPLYARIDKIGKKFSILEECINEAGAGELVLLLSVFVSDRDSAYDAILILYQGRPFWTRPCHWSAVN